MNHTGIDSRKRSDTGIRKLALLLFALVIFFVCVRPVFITSAANPSSGAVNPSGPVGPFNGTWTGTGAGGSAPNGESTCIEGVTCDTFRLSLGGNPTSW